MTKNEKRIAELIYYGAETPKELGGLLKKSPENISSLLKKLRNKGFADFRFRKEDIRNRYYFLTPSGISKIENG